jgi:hypothetical protein
MPDHLGLAGRVLVRAEPELDECIDDGVELLLGWIPRLEQVVVEVDDIDRLDRGVGVGVRGEERAARVGK